MTVVESGLWLPEYAAGSRAEDFDWWCEEYLVQTVDQWQGQPLELEPWQQRYFSEALAYDVDGHPYWKIVILVVSRKNGKTAMLAAYALYHLLEDAHLAPEVLMAASSDKQAGRLFESAVAYVRQNAELSEMLALRDYIGEIARADGLGKILRMASDPKTAHGYNASLVCPDELHAWTTPSLRKAWGAFVSGGGARRTTQVFGITTAGEALDRDESILGQLIDANEARGEVEEEPGLTISRNHQARVLVYNYSAPTMDRHDVASLKLANPASWITLDYLQEQAESPALSDAEVLQLHGCVWSEGEERFIKRAKWDVCERDVVIPDGGDVYVGIDMSLHQDCASVGWAWAASKDEVLVEAYVWAARPDVAADELVGGGDIDPRVLEDYILEVLGRRYRVREVVYDPALFSRSGKVLGETFEVAPIAQQSRQMSEAWSWMYTGVNNGTVLHRPDARTLTSHATNAVAQMTDRGWKVSKAKNSRKIDALVSTTIAGWRASVSGPKASVYERRGMLVFGYDDDGDD